MSLPTLTTPGQSGSAAAAGAAYAAGQIPEPWLTNTAYPKGQIVSLNGAFYQAPAAVPASATFNPLLWVPYKIAGEQQYANPYAGVVGFSSRIRSLSASSMILMAAHLASLGITQVREVVSWSASEPVSKGSLAWTAFDNLMSACAQAGITVLPIVTAAPQWANGTTDFNVPPTNDSDYADFCVAVWNRYRAGGAFWSANPSLPVVPITALELWNEPFSGDSSGSTFPTAGGFFHATGANSGSGYAVMGPDPIKYASMCVAAGTALRAATGAPLICICGEPYANNPGFTSWTYFSAVLAAQPTLLSSNLFDAYAVHPYVGPLYYSPWDLPQGSGAGQMLDPQGRFDRVALAKRQLLNAGGSGKQLWITEFGWRGRDDASFGVSDDHWADFTTGALRRLFREFGASRAYAYTVDDFQSSSGNVQPNSMLKYNGANAAGTIRKPFRAIQKIITVSDDLRAYRDEVLADGPVFYARLGNMAPVIQDLSRSQIQGATLSASGLTRGQASLITDPYAASTLFDGAAGAIIVPNVAPLNLSQAFTLEAWVKFAANPPAGNSALLRKMSAYHLTGGPPATFTGTVSSGSPSITALGGTRPNTVGYGIAGTGIPAGTKIGKDDGTTLTMVDGSGNPVNGTASNAGVTLTPAVAGVNLAVYQSLVSQNCSLAVADGLDIAKVWHCIGTYDGTTMLLFVNGILKKSTAKTGSVTGTTTSGSKIVTAVSAPVPRGAVLSATGITGGQYVMDVGPGTFEMSANASASGTVTITTTGGDADLSPNGLGVGNRGLVSGNADFLNGYLQEPAVYPYALSPRRIAEHYQAGAAVIAA